VLEPLPQKMPVPSEIGGSVNTREQIVPAPTALQVGLNWGGGGGLSVAGSTDWPAKAVACGASASKATKISTTESVKKRLVNILISFK
jgi:hypothetical protein